MYSIVFIALSRNLPKNFEMSTAALAAAAQAELMEKEKTIVEHQQRLQHLKSNLTNMSNAQIALEREKRRSQLTIGELNSLSEEHVVYKGIGRMFMASTVPTLKSEHADRETKCAAEAARLSEEKKKIGGALQKEEEQLQVAVADFMNSVRVIQAQQQAAPQ
jgi:chaperonin cofactor prefoldin